MLRRSLNKRYCHTSIPNITFAPVVPRKTARMEADNLDLIVKWNSKEFDISYIREKDCVGALKELIFDVTGVRPERQKLLNLRYEGKMPEDDLKLSELKLKKGFKIMMMGSLEKDIENASTQPADLPDVVDDLDVEDVKLDNHEIHFAKVQRRIKEYQINIINQPRDGKKLLVLDIDYTLFDHRSVAETGNELMRPYLHEFLTDAYRNYDIVIWSATNMKWIEEKMRLLGVASHPDYRIAFYLDIHAMISVHTPKYGLTQIKPLAVIWGKFACYTPENTIMFDDIRRNFMMNPRNGLRIKPFRKAHTSRATDHELLKLMKYLRKLALYDDLTEFNHRNWEKYLRKRDENRKRKRDEFSSESRGRRDDDKSSSGDGAEGEGAGASGDFTECTTP